MLEETDTLVKSPSSPSTRNHTWTRIKRSYRPVQAGALALALVVSVSATSWAQKSAVELRELTLEQLMNVEVEGAALHPQALADAPASVTIITEQDIYKYGYRTIAEALASVRGFYTTNDRTYTTVGVRGFQLPGDYASRFMVMINGHNLADNVLNFVVYFGKDFPVEMSLVKQIEVVRGPSSALYGSNGVFATINVVTRSPAESGRLGLTTELGSFGQKKAQFTTALPVGHGANLLISASIFGDDGESPVFVPELSSPATNGGRAIHMDDESGYHWFSNLSWAGWNVTGLFSSRDKIQPVSWGNTIWNDRGSRIRDTRGYVEAAHVSTVAGGTLKWRTYYDSYRNHGHALYALAVDDGTTAVEDNMTQFNGKWIGSQLTDRRDVPHLGTLTIGAEVKLDVRNVLSDEDLTPIPLEFVSVSRPDRSLALFAQDERKLSEHWMLNLGGRLDVSRYRDHLFAPRVAVIYRPSSIWAYKFLYGRGIRNPSAFELFYGDGVSTAANPQARQEQSDTLEVDVERKIGAGLNLLTAAYAYHLRDFLVGERAQDGLLQYQNVGKIHAVGFEVELNGRPTRWLETTASYAIQHTRDPADQATLANSPTHLAKLRFAIALRRGFEVGSGLQFTSGRTTLSRSTVTSHSVADVTVSHRRVLPNLDARFGVRNAFDAGYSNPIALNPLVDAMRQPGRSLFLDLTWHRETRAAVTP